jgi:glycosyltransferase involved in cell wall biosynthesis/GT2 family glycosyltransferase/Flp pilus assembly protein TadD
MSPVNRSLRIGVDVRGLEIESSLRRGIGRYVINLLRALAEIAPHHQFLLYGERPPWEVQHLTRVLDFSNVKYTTFHPSYSRDIDVLLLTDPAPVLTGRKLLAYPLQDVKCATIFYDLIPLAFEREYLPEGSKLRKEYLARLDELENVANRFLTISRFVADDLHQRLGISRQKIVPIMGGLDEAFASAPQTGDVQSTLLRYGISGDYFFYTGGTDYRKNLPALIQAFHILRRTHSAKLVLAGEVASGWRRLIQESPAGRDFADDLATLGYVSDEDLRSLYAGATAFVFPSLYEGFGLPALEAMAVGCPVVASDSSSLKEIVADAGLLVDPRSPERIADAMKRLLDDRSFAADLRRRGPVRAGQFTWKKVAADTLDALSGIATTPNRMVAPSRKLKVVLQNRPNSFVAPGGDTVVMKELFRALRAYDVEVEAAAGSPDLSGVDLVHVLNLTLADVTHQAAANAQKHGVPFVVTTLFEEWPRYMDRSVASVGLFKQYLDHDRDERVFRAGLASLRAMPQGRSVGNDEVTRQAALLFACGDSEATRLRDAYPWAADHVRVIKFGCRHSSEIADEGRELIRRHLGFEKYILCCGRLETRKNQLMLLKAMEDSDLPIVFATGGFSYQPAYVELVNRYERRGITRVVGRVKAEMLDALMSTASAHVLPSWYELPGLVTLEAAGAGTAVVASDWGAIRDYMPQGTVHYCQPDNPESIRDAIEDALCAGPNPEAKAVADACTWEAFGEATYAAYERILSRHSSRIRDHVVSKIENNQIEYQPTEVPVISQDTRSARFDASIIIPVYNRWPLTQKCVEAVAACHDTATYEVIVVDNHSTDETSRMLQALDGDVKILRQSENRGFASACNLGARVAEGENLVFLNNDTEVHSGWLDALIHCAREDKAIAAAGSKLLYPAGDVQHAGVAINVKGIPYHILQHFAADHPAVCEKRDMQAVTAACMLVPARIFNELGGLDEDYRNGFEDIDLCLRMKDHGMRVVYCPDSVVTHHEEASEGRKEYDAENLNLFLSRWGKKLRPDELEILARHGYTIEWEPGRGGTYRMVNSSTPRINSTPASLDEAQSLYASGEFEKAADMLQSLVNSRMTLAGEQPFETWQTLGNCLARLNRLEDAENAYHEAIKHDQSSERPYLGLGTVAMLQDNWQAAMFGFMTALAKNPETTKGEFGVGLSLAARNRHRDAVEHFEKVLNQDPENSEALFYLYRSAMESGQPALAVQPIQRYLERHPRDVNFLFNLCGAHWKSGDIAQATELCQRVLELEPNHAAATDVLEHLKSALPEYA